MAHLGSRSRRRRATPAVLLLCTLAVAGCTDEARSRWPGDTGRKDTGPADTGPDEPAPPDDGPSDSGPDAGGPDAARPDTAGPVDACDIKLEFHTRCPHRHRTLRRSATQPYYGAPVARVVFLPPDGKL